MLVAVAGVWLLAPRAVAPGDGPDPPGAGQVVAAAGSPTPDVSGPRPTPDASAGTPTPVASPSAPLIEPAPSTPVPTEPSEAGTSSATPRLSAALDARLDRLRARFGLPGVSASIVFPDGTVWQGTSGFADVATARPVTVDTAFSVASVSKTFTAALILALIEDGRLSLDSTARTYLPALKINRHITVRELLDHTSGLRDFYYNPSIDHALLVHPGKVWDATRSLRYLGPPYSKPGRSWHYSNTNYLILGLLAEAVGKAPVADQLRQRFFGPMRLDHTFYQSMETPRGPVARGYRFLGIGPDLPAIDLSDHSDVVPFTSVVTAAGAAGSIATSGADLARWAQGLYGGDVLTEASRDAMVADLQKTARYVPGVAYGLGVQALGVAGHPTLGHSGRFLGARAAVRWLADEQSSIAVLTNQSRADPNVVLRELVKLAFPARGG